MDKALFISFIMFIGCFSFYSFAMERNMKTAKEDAQGAAHQLFLVTLSPSSRLIPAIKDHIDDLAVRAHALFNTIERVNSIGCATKAQGILFYTAQCNLASALFRVINFYHDHGRTAQTFLDQDTAGVILTFGQENISLHEICSSAMNFLQDTHRFSKMEHAAIVQTIFEIVKKAPYSEKQKKMFAMFNVVRADQPDRVKLLLADDSFDLTETDEFGNTIIIPAVLHESQDIMAQILKKRSQLIHWKKQTGLVPLLVAPGQETQQFLLKHGASLDHRDEQGDTPLITAVKNGGSKEVSGLIKAGVDVHSKGAHGKMAIHWAFDRAPLISAQYIKELGVHSLMGMTEKECMHYAVLQSLMNTCAKIHEPDNEGVTPFMLAIERGHIDFVRGCIDQGMVTESDLNRPDKAGRAPKLIAFEAISQFCKHEGHACNHFKILEKLDQAGAHVDGLPDQEPPLITAVRQRNAARTENLVLCKARFDVSFQGKTALVMAREEHCKTNDKSYLHIINYLDRAEKMLTVFLYQKALDEQKAAQEKINKAKKEAEEKLLIEVKKRAEEAERKLKELEEKQKQDDAENERLAQELCKQQKATREKEKQIGKKARRKQKKIDEAAALKEMQENKKREEKRLHDKKLAIEKAHKEKEALIAAQEKRNKEMALILQNVGEHVVASVAADFVDTLLEKSIKLSATELAVSEAQIITRKKEAIDALKSLVRKNKKKKEHAALLKEHQLMHAQNKKKAAVASLKEYAIKSKNHTALTAVADSFRLAHLQEKSFAAWQIAFYQRQAIMARQFMQLHLDRSVQDHDHALHAVLVNQMKHANQHKDHLRWLAVHLTMRTDQFARDYLWNKEHIPDKKVIPAQTCATCRELNIVDAPAIMSAVEGLHWKNFNADPHYQQLVGDLNQKMFLQLRKKTVHQASNKEQAKTALVALPQRLNPHAKEFHLR